MADATSPRKRKRANNSQSTRKPRAPKQKAVECPICWTSTRPSNLVHLPTCFCAYCKSCVREAFKAGLSPSCFPARCCGRPLDLVTLEKHLPATLRRQYRLKSEQEASNAPLYCANPGCREFVSQATYKDGFGTCGICHKKTCTNPSCKRLKKDHKGIHALCPKEIEDAAIRELMDQKGWKRCPKCFCIVEKKRGCDDMRCICKAEWCYKCGKMSKSFTQDQCMCRVLEHIDVADDEEIGMTLNNDFPDLREVFGFDESNSTRAASDGSVEWAIVE